MKCPLCDAELKHDDLFGQLSSDRNRYIAGDIYRCPNGLEQNGTCDSESFSIAGSFYSYRSYHGIYEGYPC